MENQLGTGVEKATGQQLTINLEQLVDRIDRNLRQEIIVTTADKTRLCLIEALDQMERRKAWIAPAGILATLAVVFPTTVFRDFLGLSKDYWSAIFSLGTLGALVWFTVCIFRIRRSVTVEQIVNRLRTDALLDAPKPPPASEQRPPTTA